MIVMTLNVQQYAESHGPWDMRKDLIAEAIRQHTPDVIALQAVRREPGYANGVDQATQLAAMLDYRHVLFVPSQSTDDGRQEGMAMLAHAPLQGLDPCRLSLGAEPQQAEDRTPRMVLAVRLETLTLFTAHFSWVPEQAAANVAEALPYLRKATGPRLLVGDFNMTPDSPLLGRFIEDGWTDLWAWSRPQDAGYTFDAKAPDRRIDYAWATAELRASFKGIELVAARPNRHGAYLSDHLGLVVTLSH